MHGLSFPEFACHILSRDASDRGCRTFPPQGVASIFLETGSTNWACHDLYSKFSCAARSGHGKLSMSVNFMI
jgi:hypothetical protein